VKQRGNPRLSRTGRAARCPRPARPRQLPPGQDKRPRGRAGAPRTRPPQMRSRAPGGGRILCRQTAASQPAAVSMAAASRRRVAPLPGATSRERRRARPPPSEPPRREAGPAAVWRDGARLGGPHVPLGRPRRSQRVRSQSRRSFWRVLLARERGPRGDLPQGEGVAGGFQGGRWRSRGGLGVPSGPSPLAPRPFRLGYSACSERGGKQQEKGGEKCFSHLIRDSFLL